MPTQEDNMNSRFHWRLTALAVLIAAIVVSISGCLTPIAEIPTACIQAEPTIGYAPLARTFDASCSHVPESTEDIYHFQWEFEDGSEGTGLNTVHTFTEPGTYTVAVLMFRINGESIELVDIGRRVVTVLPTE
jgi:PKD repeat protein